MPDRLAMGSGSAPVDILAWEQVRSRTRGVRRDPETGAAIPVPIVAFPPEIYPTKEAQNFNVSGLLNVAGPAPNFQTIAGPFVLGPNMVGVVREITLNVNTLLVTSRITFALRFSQGPVMGFDQMFVAPRAAASVSISYSPDSVLVRIPDNSSVDIAVSVVDGGAYLMTANFRGWTYPKNTVSSW